jgi:branched-chain amino acid transport system ATP-binding protein
VTAPATTDRSRFGCRQVDVSYGGVSALVGADLQVAAGTMVGLIGSNGAGKSTLFDVLTGFVRPDAGSVVLDGADITGRSATWRARRGIRRTFQRQQTFGNLTVRENVLAALDWDESVLRRAAAILAGPVWSGVDTDRDEQVDRVLSECGLTALADASAAHLSIGEARMLELARAVIADPNVLLLDEPTSGLGDVEKDRFADVVHEIRLRTGCAVVLVEHDIPFVMEHCSEVNVLHLGSIIACGTPGEVTVDAAVRDAYLT